MPFKSSRARSAGKLFGVFKEKDLDLRGASQTNRLYRHSGPITATGGNKYTPGDGYIYHTFVNSMNSTPDGVFEQSAGGATVEVLIVAGGGGGGGGYYAGGGGGGGILEGNVPLHQPGTYTITVGAGGAAGADQNGTAVNGANSSFGAIIALGGGSGGSGPGTDDSGGGGGSGGGASYYVNGAAGIGTALPQPAPLDYTSYGNPSGPRPPSSVQGAGGGGAGAEAEAPFMSAADGKAFPAWPSSVIPILTPLNPLMGPGNNTYGGGGGGGPAGTGGVGGGGAGSTGTGAVGVDYLGGGGGGASGGTAPGGAGGDGILLIRYSAT